METTSRRRQQSAMFDSAIIVPAVWQSFTKLNPRTLVANPVMLVVEVVAALVTFLFFRDLISGVDHHGFVFQIIVWLWITVLFANFAEAVAEGRGKAQAATLRRARTETFTKRLIGENYETVAAPDLKPGDIVLVEAGDFIPFRGARLEQSATSGSISCAARCTC